MDSAVFNAKYYYYPINFSNSISLPYTAG